MSVNERNQRRNDVDDSSAPGDMPAVKSLRGDGEANLVQFRGLPRLQPITGKDSD
jgi:hypothetical protein